MNSEKELLAIERSVLDRLNSRYAYGVTKSLVEMSQHKVAGTEKEHAAADWIHAEMRKIGLEDVRREGFPVYVRDVSGGASLTVLKPKRVEISAYPMASTYPTDNKGVAGELVYVDRGTAQDFERKDVRGKVVLSKRDWPDMIGEEGYYRSRPVVEAWVRGASAVVVFDDAAPEDVVRTSIYLLSPVRIPVVAITSRDARRLVEFLHQGTEVIVNLESRIQEPCPGISYNVMGTIRGSSHPDELIIIASHYDTWWSGAADSLSGIGCIMDIARAMIEAGASPDRSILFIAHGAEEQGWPCWFDWLIGSYSNIFVNHPDWVGRIIAELNIDVVAYGLDSCNVETTPELYQIVRKTAEDIAMKPASLSYSTSPSTWFTVVDSAAYLCAGVPTADITYWHEDYWKYYHTPYDDMRLITEESLLWTSRLWAVTSLRLADAGYTSLSIAELAKSLEADLQTNSEILNSSGVQGIEFASSVTTARELKQIAAEIERNSQTAEKTDPGLGKAVLEGLRHFHRNLHVLGGIQCFHAFYASDPYARDASCIARALASLRKGDLNDSVSNLEQVYAMRSGKEMSYEGYKYYLDNWFEPRTWAVNVQRFVDVYPEWNSLRRKTNSRDKRVDQEIKSLETKLNYALSDLRNAITSTDSTIYKINRILRDALDRAIPEG